ncbi:MAG: hypothetical protein AB8I08_37070 [Sandaracinaceae bacterium]
MRWYSKLGCVLVLGAGLGLVGCDGGIGGTDTRDGSVGTGPDGSTTRPDGSFVGGCDDSTDSDADGIADQREGTGDTDGDGTPNVDDSDSDGDGISDLEESGMTGNPCAPRDSDLDGIPDAYDLDSDNDGLTDAEEIAAGSSVTSSDTDGDGVDDLTETAAGSDPSDPTSGPPPGSLYVVIPYHPPGTTGERPVREFEFATQVRSADVFFLVDTTGSMRATVASVQNELQSTIIPGVVAALGADGDARYGLASHGDFSNRGPDNDGAFTIWSNLTRDDASVAAATSNLAHDNGGDFSEAQVPAMFGLIQGTAFPEYVSNSPHGTSAAPAPGAPKTPTRMVVPRTDCPDIGPDDPEPYGWGCFVEGRLPVIVLMSDATMHNGSPGSGNAYPSVPGAPTYEMLRDEILRREAFFVGVSVGGQGGTAQYTQLATDTNSLDGDGMPLIFQGAQADTSALVVDALTAIIGSSRQDITTRTDPDTAESRLPAGRTTADFLTRVTPLRGIPAAPEGYDSEDETTFYNVAPSTRVVFEAEFYNDFQPGGTSAQVFQATIVVLGRAGTEVDERQVFMVVPADGAQIIF